MRRIKVYTVVRSRVFEVDDDATDDDIDEQAGIVVLENLLEYAWKDAVDE